MNGGDGGRMAGRAGRKEGMKEGRDRADGIAKMGDPLFMGTGEKEEESTEDEEREREREKERERERERERVRGGLTGLEKMFHWPNSAKVIPRSRWYWPTPRWSRAERLPQSRLVSH